MYAARAGLVTFVGADLPGAGKAQTLKRGASLPKGLGPGGVMVYVRHEAGTETRYLHLADYYVQSGDRVVAGDVIGAVGRTGFRPDSSTAAHLHFEWRKGGVAVDPLPELAGARARPLELGLLAAGLLSVAALVGLAVGALA